MHHQTIGTGLDLFAVSEPQKITKQGGGLALNHNIDSLNKLNCWFYWI